MLCYETFCSSRIFIYSWLIQKIETIRNKYEIGRNYIKDNSEKKSQFSVLNLTTTELSSRFENFPKRNAYVLSFFPLFFFSYLYSIYFSLQIYIIFSPGFLRVLFRPISSDFTRRPFVSFTFAPTFRLIGFLFANSSGSHLARKKFDGFKNKARPKVGRFSFKRARFYFRTIRSFSFVCASNCLVSFPFLFSFFYKIQRWKK